MLNIITGTPGSGKTLFTVNHLSNESERPIFYYGIPELKLDWQELENPADWHLEVPDNAIVVIDEVQKIYPTRDFKKSKPAGVEALETHRHRGIDLYFITQHASMLDVHIRRLAGSHRHLNRKFGASYSVMYEGNEVFDPKNFNELKQCKKSVFKFPKKAFEHYKSAEVHTHKFRLPKYLLIIPFGIMFAAYLGYSVFDRFSKESVNPNSPVISSLNSAMNPLSDNKPVIPIKSDDFNPTIPGQPGSAPVYASLWKPVTFPKLSCVSSKSKCLCYTEQSTRYFIDELTCRKIVKYGVYDFTKQVNPNNDLAGFNGSQSKGVSRFTPSLTMQDNPSSINNSSSLSGNLSIESRYTDIRKRL